MDFNEERDWLLTAISNQTDQLRELLSYCKTQDGRYSTAQQAYRDIAAKLRGILDGEQ